MQKGLWLIKPSKLYNKHLPVQLSATIIACETYEIKAFRILIMF
jgi:hypothetical protein